MAPAPYIIMCGVSYALCANIRPMSGIPFQLTFCACRIVPNILFNEYQRRY